MVRPALTLSSRVALSLVALSLAACGSPPRDDCPGGHAGQPGCSSLEPLARFAGEGCPPPDYVPEVSWGEAAETPLVSSAPALVLDGQLALLNPHGAQLVLWSPGRGWQSESMPCSLLEKTESDPTYALDDTSGSLYVLCHTYSGQILDGAFIFRREAGGGAWSQVTEVPSVVHGATALVDGGRLLLFGGVTAGEQAGRDQVLAYDLGSGEHGSWSELPRMPERRSFARGARVGSFYYLIGGMTDQRDPRVMAFSTLIYDLTSGLWSSGAPLPTPRHSHALVPLCDRILVMGGASAQGFGLTQVDVFDPVARTWQKAPGAKLASVDELPGAALFEGQLHTVVATGVNRGHRVGTLTGWVP